MQLIASIKWSSARTIGGTDTLVGGGRIQGAIGDVDLEVGIGVAVVTSAQKIVAEYRPIASGAIPVGWVNFSGHGKLLTSVLAVASHSFIGRAATMIAVDIGERHISAIGVSNHEVDRSCGVVTRPLDVEGMTNVDSDFIIKGVISWDLGPGLLGTGQHLLRTLSASFLEYESAAARCFLQHGSEGLDSMSDTGVRVRESLNSRFKL